MGLFGKKKNERILTIAWAYKFKVDDTYFTYQSPYGKSFRVFKTDIESVSLDEAGFGQNVIKINGKGTTLAELKFNQLDSKKIQEFIQKEILVNNLSQNTSSVLMDLEKLGELKDKGVITQEEFDQQKTKLLSR